MTRKSKIRSLRFVAGLITASMVCVSPNIALAPLPAQAPSTNPAPSNARAVTANYKLGPDDEIVIYAPFADDISNKPFRIEKSGDVLLPSTEIGRIHAEGLTVEELGEIIKKKLATILQHPEVAVRVQTARSQPVIVTGYVNTPGAVQLEGGMSLLEALTKVGWLRNDAGALIKIRRDIVDYGAIPLSQAVNSDTASVAEVSVAAIQNGTKPEENIQLKPHDLINVPRADIVYVIGGVIKPGGYALNEKRAVSLISLLGYAGGETPTAKLKSAIIYRQMPDGSHMGIAVNIKEAKDNAKKPKSDKQEIMLQAEDILEIPDSLVKGTVRRTFEQAVSTITGVAIYRPFY